MVKVVIHCLFWKNKNVYENSHFMKFMPFWTFLKKLMMTKFNVKVEDHDGLLMSEVTKPSLTPDSAEARFFEIVKQKCQSKENPKDADGQKKNLSIFSLFTSGKYLCLTTLNICFQFIVIVMAYYGQGWNFGNIIWSSNFEQNLKGNQNRQTDNFV